MGFRLFFQIASDWDDWKQPRVVPEKVQIGFREYFFHQEVYLTLEQATQESGTITILELPEMCRRGAQGQDVVVGLAASVLCCGLIIFFPA